MKIKVSDLKDTEKIGCIIGGILEKGSVLCLDGDLGAGKTTLTQFMAKSMGISDYITSPTFTIIKEYKGRLSLYHMDVYRIDSADDMYDLGFDEYVYSDGVTVIEWSDKIKEMLPENRININIAANGSEGGRVFDITGNGLMFEHIKEALKDYENTVN